MSVGVGYHPCFRSRPAVPHASILASGVSPGSVAR
jgi:hypothetical protein